MATHQTDNLEQDILIGVGTVVSKATNSQIFINFYMVCSYENMVNENETLGKIANSWAAKEVQTWLA